MIWLLLGLVFAGTAWWHVRENRRLAEKWRYDFDAVSAEQMVRFAWSRTMQLLYILGCAIIVILVYNWQLGKAGQVLEEASKPTEAQQQSPPPQQKIIPPAGAPIANNYYPPANPSAPLVASPQVTMDEVYNPEKKTGGNESAMDGIKKRYEDILVTYMFLKQCGKAGDNDYPIIISALAQEMASVNAPGRMQYDIITAAKGSYKEMYSRSNCNDASVNTLYAQYANYIKALSNNVSAP